MPFIPIAIVQSSPSVSGPFAQLTGTISTWDTLMASGIALASQAAGAIAWPLANLAILVPFTLPVDRTAYGFSWFNGTPSGNLDFGIYNEDGTKVVTLGSTAASGSNAQQTGTITPTALVAGSYFFAFACDNTTQTFSGYGIAAQNLAGAGIKEVSASFPLPTSLTPIDTTRTILLSSYIALTSVF